MTRKTRSPKVHRQVLDPTEVQKGVRTTGTSETLQKNREGVRGKIPNSKVQKKRPTPASPWVEAGDEGGLENFTASRQIVQHSHYHYGGP